MIKLTKQVVNQIRSAFKQRPMVSNIVTLSMIYGAGDVSQQTIRRTPSYNWKNTGHIAVFSGGLLGPFYTYWYPMLEKRFPGKAVKSLAKKMLSDQAIAGVALLTAFLIGLKLLETGDLKESIENWKRKFPKMFATSCCFWPAAQAINFAFVPVPYRALYVGMVSFIWTNIMCYFLSLKEGGMHPQ